MQMETKRRESHSINNRRPNRARILSAYMQPKGNLEKLLQRETPWKSVVVTSVLLMFAGIQISVYFTSTWQFLGQVYPGVSMSLFGWIIAACQVGCAIANPFFGWWNQRTQSTKNPLTIGFIICATGNMIYGLLPLFPQSTIPVVAFAGRFLTGFGAGTIGVLRCFIGTASTREDRLKAVSLGTTGLTAGLALGPTFQLCFLPFGVDGFYIGPLLINTYTTAAFAMSAMSIGAVIIINLFLVEDYAGIVSDEQKKDEPFLVIPKFDRTAVVLLFVCWWTLTSIIGTAGLSSAISMSMYGWSSSEAVFYNGIVQGASSIWSTLVYALLALTRIGQLDRRWHLGAGLTGFLLFHLLLSPLPFYSGSLPRIATVNGTEVAGAGGCSIAYDWCDSLPRVPMYIYLFGFSTLLGVSFPLGSAPIGTLLSEVLGPRKQGLIQGLMACAGSVSQIFVPLIASWMFQVSGYKWIMLYHVGQCSICLVLLIFLRKRVVPLCLTPPLLTPTPYKKGTFYRF